MFEIGKRAIVRDEAWARFCAANGRSVLPGPRPQYVLDLSRSEPPKVMLEFPLHWWSEDELEEVDPG
jgi:hypothetical protein